jgi:hypothetical protein
MGRARAMARQLSEQLEREVSADELLKEQSKPNPPSANRIAPPTTPYVTPTTPYVTPQAGVVAGVDPHAAPHAEYNPPTTVPTGTPSND